MSEWIDPSIELPDDGTLVWVISSTHPHDWPMGYQIMSGEVESYFTQEGVRHCRVNNCDGLGWGNYSWYFPNSENPYPSNPIIGWCEISRISQPK